MSALTRSLRGDGALGRRARVLSVLGAFAALAAGSAGAQTPDPAPAADAPSTVADARAAEIDSLLDRADARWLRRRALHSRGGDRVSPGDDVTAATRELVDLLRDEKVTRAPALSEAALLEGLRDERGGQPRAAIESYQLAQTLDPRQPAALWAEARAHLRAGDGPRAAVGPAARSLAAHLRLAWPPYLGWVQFAATVFLSVLIAGAAAVVTLLVAHGPRLVHEIEERLPRDWHIVWRRAVGWTLVLAPAAVQWLGAFALVPWGVILTPVGSNAERRLLYGWLALLACAAPVAGVVAAVNGALWTPPARAALAAAEGALIPQAADELATLADSQPRQALWKALLARTLGMRRPDEAIRLLRQAVELSPRDARLRIALGNVFYRSEKLEAAGVHYREALDIDANDPLALFNLHRVRTATLDVREADALLTRARSAAPDVVHQYELLSGAEDVADPAFGASEITQLLLSSEAGPAIRRALTLGPLSLAALAALVAALALRLRFLVVSSRRCTRCGDAYCDRCVRVDDESELCGPCHQLFTRHEGLEPAARQSQLHRIESRIRRLAWGRTLCQLVWPGLALIHEGRTLAGFIEAALWAHLIVGVLAPGRLLPVDPTPGVWAPGTAHAVAAGLFWLLAQTPALRPRPVALRAGR